MSNVLPKGEVKLSDVLDLFRKQLLAGLFSHGIATIQSFDKSNQTAMATMVYKQTFSRYDGQTKQYTDVLINYPIMLDCPCVVMGGGIGRLEMPITKGDTCIVLFNDRDMSDWVKNGQTGRPVDTQRFHSFSDAMLLVGINPMSDPWEGYNDDRVALKFGTTVLELKQKIHLANDVGDLKTVLNGMLDMLAGVFASGTAPPGGGPVVFASIADVTAYKTDVGEVFE